MFWLAISIIGVSVIIGIVRSLGQGTRSSNDELYLYELERVKSNVLAIEQPNHVADTNSS